MFSFIKSLFCKHEAATFVRNLYGDEINHCGGKRSVWACPACRRYAYRDQLHKAAS